MTLKHNVASNYIIKIEIQKLVKGLLKENEQENRFDFNAAEAKKLIHSVGKTSEVI